MKRRDFIKNIFCIGAGLALAPGLLGRDLAEAAWQDGGSELPGVTVRQTYLNFRSLSNRRVTDAIIVHHVGNTNADVSAETIHRWHLQNGWAGIVVYGCIRDTPDMAVMDLGLRALNTHPKKSVKKGAGDRNLPVTFGGVTFVPGQWLYADQDGIVVAARALA